MKTNIKNRLSFVLMLLMLCSFFIMSGCDYESAWESAKHLSDKYYGNYKVTEVYYYSGGEMLPADFDRDESYVFGGRYIRVEKKNFLISGDKVSIKDENYDLGYGLIIEIGSLNEVLDSLEQCKMVQYTYQGGLLPPQYDTRCNGFEYREFGIWGFPGLGEEDFNVKYTFSNGNKLIMTFTDPAKPWRNFTLICMKL